MIGSWFRSKQREALKQLKICAEVYFDMGIDRIKIIDKRDVNRLHHGCDLVESLPDRIPIKHLFCFDNNFHPVINKYPYTINLNNGEKHYFRKDDYIITFNNGAQAIYWRGWKANRSYGVEKTSQGFIL